uniref:Major capsid protein n=1 Tax=Vibrio phage phiMOD4.00-OM TaxID=1510633 RepID=A0A075IER9_9VIRU|nr:major capsid protein [Vibrio phage phiMOD4.00-OM]
MELEFKELVQQIKTASAEAKQAREAHEAEIKANGVALAETKAALEKAEAKQAETHALFEKMDGIIADLQAEQKRQFAGGSQAQKSMGEMFTAKAADQMGDQLIGKSFELKDIAGTPGSAGALVRPDRDPTIYRSIGGMRQLRISDLLPKIPTQSSSVEIMRLADAGGPAAMQGTAAGVGAGELQQKAKVTLEWELVSVNIPTIAVHTVASRQVLSDAPQLSSLIDSELNYKLQLQADTQLLTGDGTGQNLKGLLNDNSINDIGELASGTSSADLASAMIDHIRAAVTECQKFEYYNINGLVLNPVDWQTLETAKATDGHYLLVAFAATSSETPTVWRVPVIVTNAMPEGQFMLGDWQLGAQMYVREGVSIRVSEHHKDLFTSNAVAILAEERYALGISRPKAFCKGSFSIAA